VKIIPLLSLIFLVIVVVCALFSPLLAPYNPDKIDLPSILAPPSWSGDHPLGTDHLGRDVLSRIIYGSRISLMVAVVAVAWAAFLGTVLGLISGYLGGKTDMIIMRLVDVMMGLPYMLVALVLAAIFGASLINVIVILAILSWANYARMIRGEALRLKEQDFVALATIAGSSRIRILIKHLFPNIVNTLLILITLQVGQVILFESALSFLGIGIPPPTPSWGRMTADGRDFISSAWWLVTLPGLAIMFTVFSTNLLGDWIRDRLDPRLRQI